PRVARPTGPEAAGRPRRAGLQWGHGGRSRRPGPGRDPSATVTVVRERPPSGPTGPVGRPRPSGLAGWVTTTDHKRIGVFYMVCAFGFFLLGGVLALLMRAELASPGQDLVSTSTYNQLFTMHGSIMMFLFAVPMAFGLANYLVPLQIGAPD